MYEKRHTSGEKPRKERQTHIIKYFKENVENDPGDRRSWFYLANTYRDNEMWDQAIDAYKNYLKVGVWVWTNLLLRIFLHLGRLALKC